MRNVNIHRLIDLATVEMGRLVCVPMEFPKEPVTLTPSELAQILEHHKTARHNVNNALSMIIAAAELVKLKPDAAERYSDKILEQPDRIIMELKSFGDELEKRLRVKKG